MPFKGECDEDEEVIHDDGKGIESFFVILLLIVAILAGVILALPH